MKKFLLPEGGNFYKANLHCHSTVSDGTKTPEQLKEMYKAHGYSVIAYTDHNAMVPHTELADGEFLPLLGYELDVTEQTGKGFADVKTCHMCFIAIRQDARQVCFHRSKYLPPHAFEHMDEFTFDRSLPDYERVYSPEGVSDMMRLGREGGFFVTYNHPSWSLENYADYTRYENMHAMEICNYGCIATGYNDYNEKEYDDMLRSGKRIFCISTDDNHNRVEDSFGGFTVIKADRLEYNCITDALVRGSFYASQGPEIYGLYVEDGRIAVSCSPASRIRMNTARRVAGCVFAEEGKPLTFAEFGFDRDDRYVRITVTDDKGRHANTNAYFTDELI